MAKYFYLLSLHLKWGKTVNFLKIFLKIFSLVENRIGSITTKTAFLDKSIIFLNIL